MHKPTKMVECRDPRFPKPCRKTGQAVCTNECSAENWVKVDGKKV